MNVLLKQIRDTPLLWLLAFVPVVLAAEHFKPEAHTLLFVMSVLAIVPLTSPMLMPVRIATGEATIAEMALSLAVGVATVALVARVGSRIYSRAIGRTGRRLKVREVLA